MEERLIEEGMPAGGGCGRARVQSTARARRAVRETTAGPTACQNRGGVVIATRACPPPRLPSALPRRLLPPTAAVKGRDGLHVPFAVLQAGQDILQGAADALRTPCNQLLADTVACIGPLSTTACVLGASNSVACHGTQYVIEGRLAVLIPSVAAAARVRQALGFLAPPVVWTGADQKEAVRVAIR
jgi:hypothetical protein